MIRLCGGIDNISAKGGFRMPDGSIKYWVASAAVEWRHIEAMEDADDGITLIREPYWQDGEKFDKVTATCPDAVGIA